jgi:threonine/homoserine/homoserine lactone efflux protein
VPSSSQWLAYAIASLIFVELPGPSLLFTLGRALSVGRRQAQLSAIGNAIGQLVQVLAVVLGLGALVAASATAYTVLKLAGAAYVVWLGVRAIRHRADARIAMTRPHAPGRRDHPVRTGIVVGVTNPKTIVFFAAFLPQFTDPGHAAVPQLLVLGVPFCVLAATSDCLWATLAGRAREWFSRRPQRLDRLGAVGGVMMIGMGLALATTSTE